MKVYVGGKMFDKHTSSYLYIELYLGNALPIDVMICGGLVGFFTVCIYFQYAFSWINPLPMRFIANRRQQHLKDIEVEKFIIFSKYTRLAVR